jgi:hypothetical protein
MQAQARCVDQSRERGWLLTPARVIEKEARERLAPIFDLTLPLDKVAKGCCAMDERRAIKTLLRPDMTVGRVANLVANLRRIANPPLALADVNIL